MSRILGFVRLAASLLLTAPVLTDITNEWASNGYSPVAVKPTDVEVDDLLIIVAGSEGFNSGGTATTPTGWNLLGSAATSQVTVTVFWRIADGTEPASVTLALNGNSGATTGHHYTTYMSIRGVDTSDPFDDFVGATWPSGTNATFSSLTTTVGNTLMIGAAIGWKSSGAGDGGPGDAANWAPPSGWTERADGKRGDGTFGTGSAYTLDEVVVPGTGATGTSVAVSTQSHNNYASVAFAIKGL